MDSSYYKNNPINVLVVEDDDATREAIVSLIQTHEGFNCVNSFAGVEEVYDNIDDNLPDVALMDIHLRNGKSGIECVKKLKSVYPNIDFLMLTVYEDDDKIFESIKAGARGYILKKVEPQKIIEAIKDAFEGGSPITPSIAKKILNVFSKTSAQKVNKFDLTAAETKILKHLVDGSSYMAIAEDLGKSVHTVRSHIRNIYSKLYVHSKTEAVVKAMKHKLI